MTLCNVILIKISFYFGKYSLDKSETNQTDAEMQKLL